jgi:hypothetical protein
MTKAERRKARKAARAAGEPLTGELAIVDEHRDDGHDSTVFSETPRGYAARERWARAYDDLNGAPENDGDR